MSRKVITIFFTIGSCLYLPGFAAIIWGYVTFFQNNLQNIDAGISPYSGMNPYSVFNIFTGLTLVGFMLAALGGIFILVAEIGALIELAKAHEWAWFVLMIIFSWIVLLIYLIAGPRPKPAPQYAPYPFPYTVPAQPWQSYSPQMMPPPAVIPGTFQPPARPFTAYQPPAEQQYRPDKPQE